MKRARIRRPHEPSQLSIDCEIARGLTETYDSPLDFVELAYPWGEPGELAGFTGPDRWQREFLKDLGDQVRERGFQRSPRRLPHPHGDSQRTWHRKVYPRGVDRELDHEHATPLPGNRYC